jgi:hypothetical protein
VSLKARLRGLEARVEWLQDWGELRKLARQIRYLEAKEKIIERAPELAIRFGLMPPPKAVPTPPAPPQPPPKQEPHREDPRPTDTIGVNSARRLDSHSRGVTPAPGCAETTLGAGSSGRRDASPGDAPPGEVVPRPASHAPPVLLGQPVVQPFVPIQSGLVRWRQRGPEDDWDADEPLENEDYDPFADES